MNKLIQAFAVITLAFMLAACGSDEPEPETVVEEAAEPAAQPDPRSDDRRRRVVTDGPPPTSPSERAVPRLQGQLEDEGGYGMTLIIDASDEQSFRDSLAMIAAESSADEYRQLDSSIRYLQLYSPMIMNRTDRLYQNLHGRSGEEILEMARELRRQRSGE